MSCKNCFVPFDESGTREDWGREIGHDAITHRWVPARGDGCLLQFLAQFLGIAGSGF